MTFDFKETRYSHDQDGTVYDNLVEYCIDFITGHTRLPDFFPFALNRVFREYLQFGGPQDLDCAYKPLRVIVTEYGVVLDHPHNFVEDDWSRDLSCRFNILASEKDTYYADWIGYKREGTAYVYKRTCSTHRRRPPRPDMYSHMSSTLPFFGDHCTD